ncbi:MAG: hypothetical protein FWG37_00465 [Clostridia bacterium]|nr:hypothetical protein [Clostridia bacterium]
MTGKEKMQRALRREPITGHVPHFELVFFLTMEVLGKVHPEHRSMHQWNQMSAKERELHLQDQASCYIDVAEKYSHSAIFVHPCVRDCDALRRLLEIIRERTGDEYFLMMHGDPTFSIPDGDHMVDFSVRMYEDAKTLCETAQRRTDSALEAANMLAKTGLLDGYALCADYCFNHNPFFSPELFDVFITPYLKQAIAGYREMGFFSIKHTDGNIMPIIDQMIDCGPDALHSLDPQGGVDLKLVKECYGRRVCLIGNVNCGLLQTGTEEQVRADVLRSLRDGMPGFGYVFSTSNCVYSGLALQRYEFMHALWREHGVYQGNF